eukprot:7691121-Ditylum_brightwellii.AAC.1
MPVQWLAGCTHKLSHHNWGVCSIGRMFDMLHLTLNKVLTNIKLIHDKSTMMNIFEELYVELPESKDYSTYKFEMKKTQNVVKSSTKAVPLKLLLKELFTSQDIDNKEATSMLE